LLQVGTNYDPMIAKIVTHAADRESALQLLRQALAETQVRTLVGERAFAAAMQTTPDILCSGVAAAAAAAA
jgi:acetyl/propionyl-CoA carboxylase alpha subunit